MILAEPKYIQNTNFRLLDNWSVQYLIESTFSFNQYYQLVRIGDFLTRSKTPIEVKDEERYKRVTIKINNGGIFLRDIEIGKNIGTKNQFLVKKGQFLLSKIDARNGAFGVVPQEVDGAIITGNFWTFDVDYSKINPHFLALLTTTPEFIKFSENASNGTTNRHYLQEDLFLNVKIPLPTLEEQNQIVQACNNRIIEAKRLEDEAKGLEDGIEEYLFEVLGIVKIAKHEQKSSFQITNFRSIERWAVDFISKLITTKRFLDGKFNAVTLGEFIDFFQYGLSEKSTKENVGIPMLRMNNIYNSELTTENLKYITIDNKTKEKYLLEKGDLLFNRTNSKELVGKTAVFDQDGEYVFASYIIRVKINPEKANADYINMLFNSSLLQYQKDMVSRKILGQANINSKELQDFLFPLPELSIQEEIVGTIKDIKDKIKQLHVTSESNRRLAITEFESKIFIPCN